MRISVSSGILWYMANLCSTSIIDLIKTRVPFASAAVTYWKAPSAYLGVDYIYKSACLSCPAANPASPAIHKHAKLFQHSN